MTKEEFYKIFKELPKAEIHIHTEAIIDKKLVSMLLSRKHAEFKDLANVDKLFSYNNLKDFIKAFLLIQNSFKEKTDFQLLFSNIKEYLFDNGIVYAELFFSPSIFLKNGWKFNDLMDIILEEVKLIRVDKGIIIKILIDVSRTFGVENAMKNLEELLKYKKSDDIIGIGLGGDELKGPANKFGQVFKKAHDNNFHTVVHAGEDDGPNSVWDAIKLLGAERIGHGISSIHDELLIQYLIEKQIPLEICPTSNVFTKRYVDKIENHPIKQFYQKGVIVTLNTDDPTFFKINLIDEYWNLFSKLQFQLSDLKVIIINSFKASFLPENQKNDFINKVNSVWNKYFPD